MDGHVVKSKGELIIDNFLHNQGINHIYEKTIKVHGNPIKYDWYLPDIDVYIEYYSLSCKALQKAYLHIRVALITLVLRLVSLKIFLPSFILSQSNKLGTYYILTL